MKKSPPEEKRPSIADVFDTAKYILEQVGSSAPGKLHKLVYYAQAWSLVWDKASLFSEEIEAWVGGPIVPKLYDAHKGLVKLKAKDIAGDSKNLTQEQRETVDSVLKFYGHRKSQWLADLVCLEHPWGATRKANNLKDSDRGCAVISLNRLYGYYSNIDSSV
jgi:uncharacterized phage-associated protein